jgi:cytochrome c oxidase subunit III
VSVSVAFIALLAGVVVWLLLARRLTAKPWETPASTEDVAAHGAVGWPPAKMGLWILLAVITSLFGLFITAYWMRMEHAHGTHGVALHPAPVLPQLLWLNTAVLILSSAGMQWARAALRRAQPDRLRAGLIVGGVLALGFLAGQLLAWRQLSASGYFIASNPAIAFFYLLTAVHGLHLLGGLLVWGKTVVRTMQPGVELMDVRLSVELCTVYWHYLLLVWLVLFGVLLAT